MQRFWNPRILTGTVPRSNQRKSNPHSSLVEQMAEWNGAKHGHSHLGRLDQFNRPLHLSPRFLMKVQPLLKPRYEEQQLDIRLSQIWRQRCKDERITLFRDEHSGFFRLSHPVRHGQKSWPFARGQICLWAIWLSTQRFKKRRRKESPLLPRP